MKVVVVGSLSRECDILECKHYFEKIGAEVVTPLEYQNGSLYDIQVRYAEFINQADLIVAIPKNVERPDISECPYGFLDKLGFGESTSYEIAMAITFGKRVVYWFCP